jgi:hypothetical protein
MKKFLIIIFVSITGIANAQTFSNSWIDYSKTYYKFKVGANGLYHISQATLNSIGLGNTPAEQFQLWRNGKQVTIYTTSSNGPLVEGGYIEFWGVMNDGKIDTKLYRVADFQLCDQTSLQTDTASYFLTTSEQGNNARFSDVPNPVSSNTLAPEPYFMNKKANYFKSQLNPGYASVVGSYVYSSSYDIGEGWTSADIYPSRRLQASFNNNNIYTAGPGFSLKFAAVGSAVNDRNVRVKIFNTVVDEQHMPYFTYIKKELKNLPMSYLTDLNNIQVFFENTSTVTTDRMVVAFDEVTYPSKWIFNNQTNFYFELPATEKGNYLVIDQFKYGSAAPVLLDFTANKRYTGDITTPGKVKFVLPPSADTVRKFVLVSEDPSAITNISKPEKREFVNYAASANQGDYLIITNPILFTSSSGSNYVDLYSQYRHSSQGGGYNTKIIDINQLEDQFGYGIKKHPSSIKDFIQYATNTFSIKPKYVFLIGKGIEYDQYTVKQSSQYADRLNLVPTFGAPASDVLLVSPYGSIVPSVGVGRLSAITGDEVANYLEKVKTYEQAYKSTNQSLADKLWMKKVINIVGGKDSSDNDLFGYYMNLYKDIIEDTLYGANVETFSKSSSAAVQLIASQRISDLFKSGISMVNYFGHSSSNILEFNLSDPSEYDNEGRYPFFFVSGCTAGNNYIYDSLRIINNSKSISENFVLSKQRGSIGFLASSHLGIPPYLNNYNIQMFHQLSGTNYGKPVGDDIRNTIEKLGGNNPSLDFFTRMHLEEMALHGDPSIIINPQPKPDYVVEDQNIILNPQFISVSESNFTLKARAFNIGRAIDDSIVFEVKRTYPNGNSESILKKKIKAIYYSDSIEITVPIISTRDKGLNKITVTIDATNKVDEMSETNNSVTKEFFIYEDEARPIFPADFGIVTNANQKLYASTSNAVATAKDYVMEIDTTLLFNSPFKISKTVNQPGGALEFDPGLSFNDNTVYYWRVAVKPASGVASDYRWNGASFIYLANSTGGANQSHYYQQLYSDTQHVHLDSSRLWHFGKVNNFLESRNGVFPTASSAGSDCIAGINGVTFSAGICPNGTNNVIIFNVVNNVTLKAWSNTLNLPGLSGSLSTCIPARQPNFAYDVSTSSGRVAAMRFMDSIPDNFFVFVRNITGPDSTADVFANKWQADTSFLGSGNSLYHKLKSQGFVLIDSFYRPRAFSFIYQKNNPEFGPGFAFTKGISDVLDFRRPFVTTDTLGFITSPKFGPAASWKEMHWRGKSLDNSQGDNPSVQIIGIDTLGNSTTLFNVNKAQQDVDISSVNASKYPYIQLKMRNADSLNFTPYQLSYWRLNYQAPPEGALAPQVYFKSKDTLEQGEILHFGIAFKNISLYSFDSIKVKLNIIDNNNVTHVLNVPTQKPLIAGDTIKLNYDIDTKNFRGLNTLFVNFNPDNDQPELNLFNNFLYQNFYVKYDNYNPTMDVTFDGVHILNKDIVSARPHIIIKLKDENKSLALNDTSLLKVQIQSPDGSIRAYRFDNNTMRFTPANLATGENTATIDLTPELSGEDAEYELIVSGKDVVGNEAGRIDYHIDFRVISKPMISNMMNYPNPFTTSTAFVFTITGAQVPQNIRIQILTITGKVIREITQNELGPLHIGRNITDFKWDGTDMYGQKVANGVYLYRVLTNLNGHSMDKFKDADDDTDKFFTKGYGKMYLMR